MPEAMLVSCDPLPACVGALASAVGGLSRVASLALEPWASAVGLCTLVPVAVPVAVPAALCVALGLPGVLSAIGILLPPRNGAYAPLAAA